jgi:class 3 adenylate cyclase
MLQFEAAAGAVLACLDIVRAVGRIADAQARAGLATGAVVQRDGDVFGTTVNLAARIADHAGPGQVLVCATTRRAGAGAGLAFEDPVPTMLKGLGAPVPLSVVRSGA